MGAAGGQADGLHQFAPCVAGREPFLPLKRGLLCPPTFLHVVKLESDTDVSPDVRFCTMGCAALRA